MAKQAETKEKKSYSVHTMYEASGDSLKRKNKSCPKCGPGTYLGEHKDRVSCGKCQYSEKK
jgi:small subunit ribosomal protein S27Ae